MSSSGNFGTIDIGSASNGTPDLRRQIRNGISDSDLVPFGGEFKLGSDGTLDVTGDTGLSAGMKDELLGIAGQTRIIPLYSSTTNTGNNTVYSIVGFAGVRIMKSQLTGAKKGVVIQLANIVSDDAIVDEDLNLANDLVYTLPRFTR